MRTMSYESLAAALGITVQELNLLDYYNEEIFDDSGLAVRNKFVFNDDSPSEILTKIKGLDQYNSVTLNA